MKHFRQFLMTYVDEHGTSVYGQRIRQLGEGNWLLSLASTMLRVYQPTPSLSKFLTFTSPSPSPSLPTSSPTRPLPCLKFSTRSL